MPYFRIAGHMVHLKLGGPKSKQPKPCVARIPADPRPGTVQCCGVSGFLCDHKLADGKTCDAPLCEEHAHQVAKDRHLCPVHLAAEQAARPELF